MNQTTKGMRKLLAVLLVAIMAIGVISQAAFAAENGPIVYLDGIEVKDADVIIDDMELFLFPQGITSAKTVFKDVDWDAPGMPTGTEAMLVETVAEELGYEFQENGRTICLAKTGLFFRQNNTAVTFEYYWMDDEVMVRIGVLWAFFAEEMGTRLPTGALCNFTEWAETYGYKVVRYENYYWFNNDGKKPIMMSVNDETVFCQDQQPVVKEGRTLVPIAVITSALGGEAIWDSTERSATIQYEDTTIKIFIGQKDYYVNGKELTMDIPAEIINGRTMVPLRVTGEALGYDVKWDPGTQIDWIRMEKD